MGFLAVLPTVVGIIQEVLAVWGVVKELETAMTPQQKQTVDGALANLRSHFKSIKL